MHGGPTLLEWHTQLDDALIVGHDVVAGFFAVDRQDGEVRYLAPDTLEWEGTEMGHAAWVHWTLTGEIGPFYESLRWPGWEEEAASLPPDTGLSLDPPPFARGGRPGRRRRPDAGARDPDVGAQQEFIRRRDRRLMRSRIPLALFFVGAGIMHFVKPRAYKAIVPDALPRTARS